MSMLAEIEAAVSKLTLDELKQLEIFLNSLKIKRAHRIFAGREAIAWWRKATHLTPPEAEFFAADMQAARTEIGMPASRWE